MNRTFFALTRRRVLGLLAGGSAATFSRALAALADEAPSVTPELVKQAEWIAGIELSDDERKRLAGALESDVRRWRELNQVKLDNSVQPSLVFQPAIPQPGAIAASSSHIEPIESAAGKRPPSDDALAFLPLTELAALVRSRQITAREITSLYLARLKRYDPALHCVVNLTEELAMKQAAAADREIAAGRYRGALHGIPWGAKDLIAYPGYPTTWGALPFKTQTIETKATVAARLEAAGAVLAAKLSLGALAMGDRWFDVTTRNPWNKAQGSSGSSAGSAAAVAAGLVGFAIGSETLGSIVSPCRRCGATGLRPTFGRVSRHGCMTLAWSMDKLGPIARSVEDCALVFGAIHGADGYDASAVDRSFSWPSRRDVKSLTVGYFEESAPADEREELRVLRDLGMRLVPLKLPHKLPVRALTLILNVEAAAAFDELTRQGTTQGLNEWPRIFKQARFVPAVAYLQANRVRTLLVREMEKMLEPVDAYVGGDDLTITNLTGHPSVVLPNGIRERDGVKRPGSLTFTGRLYGETELLAIAHAYQQATGHHLHTPPMDRLLRPSPPKEPD
jgi:Asp-tRNA(Asn)/Glu-tRNA(Gln) amidotransferase A subunit family amidase